MTLHECKNGLNVNKVRFFDNDQLSSACKESWDRVKIVCTQPYIKQAKFGLSFIIFHSNDLPKKESIQSQLTQLGSFTLRNEDEEPDEITFAGRLFAKRHDNKEIVRMPESPINRLLAIHKQNLETGKLKNTDSKNIKNHSPLGHQQIPKPLKDIVQPKKINTSIKKNDTITSTTVQNKGMVIIVILIFKDI